MVTNIVSTFKRAVATGSETDSSEDASTVSGSGHSAARITPRKTEQGRLFQLAEPRNVLRQNNLTWALKLGKVWLRIGKKIHR